MQRLVAVEDGVRRGAAVLAVHADDLRHGEVVQVARHRVARALLSAALARRGRAGGRQPYTPVLARAVCCTHRIQSGAAWRAARARQKYTANQHIHDYMGVAPWHVRRELCTAEPTGATAKARHEPMDCTRATRDMHT